jgi:hypothetical protein
MRRLLLKQQRILAGAKSKLYRSVFDLPFLNISLCHSAGGVKLSEVVVSGFSGRAAGIQLNRASDVEAKDISFRQIKLEKTVIVRFILQ